MPDSSFEPESGVTPIIGTILVLAITVAGMSVTLFLGLPVLEKLRDQSALESVVGQFQDVRHAVNGMQVPGSARTPTISLPAGTLTIGPGTTLTISLDGVAQTPHSTDALLWTSNRVSAAYEFGGILSQEDGQTYAAAMPRVSEEGTDFYLSLPLLDGQAAALTGDGDHAVLLELETVTVHAPVSVANLQFQFAGDRAEAWCETFRIRNTLVPLSPSYAASIPCTTLTYSSGPAFNFHLTEVSIAARLQV